MTLSHVVNAYSIRYKNHYVEQCAVSKKFPPAARKASYSRCIAAPRTVVPKAAALWHRHDSSKSVPARRCRFI